jgi:hypothetical protein
VTVLVQAVQEKIKHRTAPAKIVFSIQLKF